MEVVVVIFLAHGRESDHGWQPFFEVIRKGVQRRERFVACLDQFFTFVRRKIGREGHKTLLEKRVDRACRRDRELGEKLDRFLQILFPLGEHRRHLLKPFRSSARAFPGRVILLLEEREDAVAAFAHVGLRIGARGMPDAIVEGRAFELGAEEDPINSFVFRPGRGLHRVHFFEQGADVLLALGDFLRRVIRQAIVPGMEPGVAAPHRILLVAPVVIIVRHLVQPHRLGAALQARVGCGQQRLVRNVWCALRRNLCDRRSGAGNE